jgi:rubredoxin
VFHSLLKKRYVQNRMCILIKWGNQMKRYKCKVCGYIYDPEVGEPRTNTSPGTPFEDLPDDWHCPKCGAGKMRFYALG